MTSGSMSKASRSCLCSFSRRGTQRREVLKDYNKMLSSAIQQCEVTSGPRLPCLCSDHTLFSLAFVVRSCAQITRYSITAFLVIVIVIKNRYYSTRDRSISAPQQMLMGVDVDRSSRTLINHMSGASHFCGHCYRFKLMQPQPCRVLNFCVILHF